MLCEKPLATSEAEGARMARAAGETDRFLMEAMWTRFLPVTQRFLTLAEEATGEDPANLHVDFTFHPQGPPEHRLRDPQLAGGALLDVGVYALSPAPWLLGEPDALPDAVVPVANELPGFAHQIREVHARLREGHRESPVLPLASSLGVLRTMDRLRGAWGLACPFESPGGSV